MPRTSLVRAACLGLLIGSVARVSGAEAPLAHELRMVNLQVGPYSRAMSKQQRVLIRDEEMWREFLASLSENASAMPKVDFARGIVAVAALGPSETQGTRIRIDRAVDEGGIVTLNVLETIPGENCIVLTIQTFPVSVVFVPASARRIVWEEHRKIDGCE